MRSTWKVLGAAASFVLVSQLAVADTMEQQFEKMQQRMSQLEDQLQATNDDLQAANGRVEHQQQVLDSAGLAEGGAISGLSSFLSDTDFYGWVNASYTQGFRGDSGSVGGQNVDSVLGISYPYHPDNMSFSVNQVWFGMDHASTEQSRAGFHIDMLFGKDAGLAGVGGGNDTANSFELFTAYVSYLAPIGNGVEFQGGKVGTLNGAESVNANANFNITRGLVWALQPINTTGLLMSTTFGGGISATFGILNDVYSPSSTDNNQDKSFTGQLAWADDTFSAALTGNWGYGGIPVLGSVGPPPAATTVSTGLLDLVFTADPSDNLSFWFNYDWTTISVDGAPALDVDAHAFAAAGRIGITDSTGVALRGEYVFSSPDIANAWSVTMTADHALTDNLKLRGEVRYDGASLVGAPNNVFCGKGGCTYDDQWVFLVDATYEF